MSEVLTGRPRVSGLAPRGIVAPGDRVRWMGEQYTVSALSGTTVHLATAPGSAASPIAAAIQFLAVAEDFAVLDETGLPLAADPFPNWAMLEGVSPDCARDARTWRRHIIEVETGLLPGVPEGSRPREGYDPDRFTLVERYQRKAAELSAVLEWKVSWQTVQRKRLAYLKEDIWGLVDKRCTRKSTLHGRTDARVVDLLLALHERQAKEQAATDARTLFKNLRRAARATLGPAVKVPKDPTLYALLKRLGIDALQLRDPTRRRKDRLNRPAPPFGVTTATAPGELVQIDSTALDVKVLGDDGQPTQVELTAAIDVFTRSIIAAILRPKTPGRRRTRQQTRALLSTGTSKGRATKAVDASLLLALCMVPAPMRPGFDAAASAARSDLPYEELLEVDARMEHAAARPVIMPETIVIDHGTVFTGQTFFDACSYLGISPRPARKRTPTDKAIVERTFESIKSLFSQHVNSYTGRDFSRRGKEIGPDRLWTLQELDDLLQEWIAIGWQARPHEELRSPYEPNLPPLTPNQVYAAGVQAAGYVPIPLGFKDYLQLLPTAWVGVRDEGIRFKNRTYDNYKGELEEVRNKPSGLKGKKRDGWELRYNPYTPEQVWLRDHRSGEWITAVFKHQHLIGAPWTQHLWETATAEHVARGGRHTDDENIAQVLADLLERAGRGPDEPGVVSVPDGYGPLPGLEAGWAPPGEGDFDPFAGATALDLDALGPLTVLELDETSLYAPDAPSPADAASAGAVPGWEAPGHAATEEASLLADLDDLDDGLDDAARLLLDLPTETDPPQEDM
ncbi:DDE-type integrase/transposase/recombinase [Streptomyces ipomoeae]|uniref:DDE-type integrase/transposase/recombinase n=1 Tax=Streptomyces ipomoeae TaxID=103232 RepID=UPI0011464D35|nr:DDE-type integrase/transposase/recombinase [Streptomyces ipomoeae]MDX2939301.1 DDE-type integrase/transposase/recombinase [Streptomyces ipomoeae]TQE22514.1 transposase [Streptomyces ipomoeae]